MPGLVNRWRLGDARIYRGRDSQSRATAAAASPPAPRAVPAARRVSQGYYLQQAVQESITAPRDDGDAAQDHVDGASRQPRRDAVRG